MPAQFLIAYSLWAAAWGYNPYWSYYAVQL